MGVKRSSATFVPNQGFEHTIKTKNYTAIYDGIRKFHKIEIEEEFIPAMSGNLQREGIHPYDYGFSPGAASAGTEIELVDNNNVELQEIGPQVQRLFNGYNKIHTTIEEHTDIDYGGKNSYRSKHGDNPITHANASDHWTEKVLTGANFREEILKTMGDSWVK